MRKIIIWGIICLFILGCSNRKRAIIELTNYHIEFGKISQGEWKSNNTWTHIRTVLL